MARGKRIDIRLIIAVFVALFLFSGNICAKEMPKRHLSSSESLSRHKEMKRWSEMRKSTLRIKIKKIGSVKLKKSTFWNKKPFQFSTPLIVDSKLFIGVDAGVFYGVDADKVKKLWQYKTEGPVQAQASSDGSVVYFGDAKGYAYALDGANGSEIWKVSVEAPILAAPLILNDRVFFVTDTGRLVALGKDNGQEILRTESIEKSIGFSIKRASNPVWSDGLIIFGTAPGALVAYRENGNLAWVRQLGDRQEMVSDVDSRPLIDGGRIYVASADRNVFCLEHAGGNILWSTPDVGGPSDVVLENGKLYATGGGILAAINPADGDAMWEQDFETPEVSSPAVFQKIIAVITTYGKLYFVDDETGEIVYDRNIRKGSYGDPVFIGDHLYFISNTGRLFGFIVREKQKGIHLPK